MTALEKVLCDDEVLIRQYLAAIIGATRAPYGQRKNATLGVGESVEITRNSTRDRVLHVTVTRASRAANAAIFNIIFSQQDQVSTNDFEVNSTVTDEPRRFTLRPGESLSLLVASTLLPGARASFTFGIDTF